MLPQSGRQTGKHAGRTLYSTVQSIAGVLPDESVEMDWLETQSLCRNSPWFWLQSRRMTSDGLSIFPLLSPSLVLFLSSMWQINVQERQRHRGNQLGPISWQKLFHIFDCASSFVLSLGVMVGSRDTMGGTAIKGLLLEHSLPYTKLCIGVYMC